MGRQHRSSKLLNKATNIGGKLTLYTELNNTLTAGDYVYISGGYYDNTTDNVFSTIWLTNNNIFTNQTHKAYKVLSVNIAQNSVTLDYNVPISPFFPYCSKTVTTNVYADPTDVLDPAYASEIVGSGDSAYYHVYISQVFNGATRVKKGNIHNGIFGTDTVLNFVGNLLPDGGNSIMKNDLIISHICAKRIKMDYGTVTSKSFSSEPTTKFKVDIYSPTFNLIQEVFPNNNDNQGYAYFQTSFFGSIYSFPYSDIELKRSKIGNGGYFYNSGCYVSGALISGAYMGCDDLSKPDSTVLEDCKIENQSVLRNVKLEVFATTTKMEDSSYYAGNIISVSPALSNSIVFDGTDTITFTNFDQTPFIKKKLEFSAFHKFYLLGIRDQTTGEFVSYLNGLCTVTAFSYTYGTPNSGSITLKFSELAANAANFITNYTYAPGPGPGTYYSDNLTLVNLNFIQGAVDNDLAITNTKLPYIFAKNNTLNIEGIITNDPLTPTGRVTLIGNIGFANINVIAGYINNTTAVNSVHFNFGNKVIYDMHQFLPETEFGIFFDKCIFKADTTSGVQRKVYSGIFNDCLINSGNFTNSSFYNTRIIKSGSTSYLFLYNSRALTTTYVDENVEWELMNFNPYVAANTYPVNYSLSGGYYVRDKHGYFQGRLTPFVVSTTDQISATGSVLGRNDFTYNLSNTKTNKMEFFYSAPAPNHPSGTEYISAPTYNILNGVNEPLHNNIISADVKLVPLLLNNESTIAPGAIPANATLAVFNLGHTYYVTSPYAGYQYVKNFNYLMVAENKTLNTAFYNAAANVFGNFGNPMGTGTIDPDLAFNDTHTTWDARSNCVYTHSKYHKYNTVQNVANKQAMMFWSNHITSANPADKLSQFFDVAFKAKGLTSLTVTPLTANATTIINETVANEGSYLIYFEQMAWWNSFGGTIADLITQAYMDIDSIIIEKYDAINGNIISQPRTLTYETDPTMCGSISALAFGNFAYNNYARQLAYNGNTTITNYKPTLYTLNVVPGDIYKIEINIQIYSYMLYQFNIPKHHGKSEFRKYYLWLDFT